MPKDGKRGYGMTFGRKAVMPREGKKGNGMTFGKKATNTREVSRIGCL